MEWFLKKRKGVFSVEFTLILRIATGSSLALHHRAQKSRVLAHANLVRQLAAADTERGFDTWNLNLTINFSSASMHCSSSSLILLFLVLGHDTTQRKHG